MAHDEERVKKFNTYAPPIPHLVLPPDLVKSKQVLVIGDVHGCYDELVELLEVAGVSNNPNAIVIFVGDLVNKGPKSKEVLDLVCDIGAYSVRGNHDHRCVIKLIKLREDPTFKLEEKYKWISEIDDSYIKFFKQLPYTISIPSLNAVIVHGGLVPGVPLNKQRPLDMMTMRNVVTSKDETTGNMILYNGVVQDSKGQSWASFWTGPEHVYYGHDAARGLVMSSHATGLDTKCVYGHCLTGIFLTGKKQIVQVKAKRVYFDYRSDEFLD
ncbi:bis(5'-nucleosyl)-tetraphosphatase PrpE [asymmetrical]-like [Amphiura filiformis]|uniref:bis(5'-nucleosyl)-tetraphosphatase PrpE [asymmetrical]-like n=1 Tax=Amphiura filiformis TaxID=82378 RepID=UPI003B21D534